MNEKPILFSTPMVKAILQNRKSQTRRVIKPQPFFNDSGCLAWITSGFRTPEEIAGYCPYGKVGSGLWVRETAWYPPPIITEHDLREGADTWPKVFYSADGRNFDDLKEWGWKQKPSIFMPRWASRITLEITEVRVQRLHAINEIDAAAEGVTAQLEKNTDGWRTLVDDYKELWDKINGKKYPWSMNPWVWAITFKVVKNGQS